MIVPRNFTKIPSDLGYHRTGQFGEKQRYPERCRRDFHLHDSEAATSPNRSPIGQMRRTFANRTIPIRSQCEVLLNPMVFPAFRAFSVRTRRGAVDWDRISDERLCEGFDTMQAVARNSLAPSQPLVGSWQPASSCRMSAIGGTADMVWPPVDVRF